MARTTRLRERDTPLRPNARIIDADFVVVRKGGGWATKLVFALAAAAIAILLGMLTPPLVLAATQIARLL